jgi:hypothetical protein
LNGILFISPASGRWQTGPVRVYIPAIPADAEAPDLSARPAFAVTPALRAELPDEDIEGLEYAAFLAAADASVPLLATAPPPMRRTVIAADVPARHTTTPEGPDPHPATIVLTAPVPWTAIAAIHIDEPDADADIRLALTGDQPATIRLEDRDLLWYAPTERGQIGADPA